MLIREMHNKIELRLQKMGSHVYDWIQSEQVDSYLNDNILAFVKNRSNTFSGSQKAPFHRNMRNLEDLRSLTVELKGIQAYTEDNGEFFTSLLPGDFMFLVESSASVSDVCKYPNGFPPTSEIVRYETRFDLPFNSTNLSSGTDTVLNFPGYQDPDMKFAVHNILRPFLRTSKGDIYFDGNSYLFVRSNGSTDTFISVDTVDAVNEVTVTQYDFVEKTLQVYPENDKFNSNRVRIIRLEEFSHYKDHPFAKSSTTSPSGYVIDNNIYIHAAKRFILSNMDVVYIRKPSLVSLYLDKSCDLPEHTHEEIVDRSVADILETIESQRTQSKMIINSLND